MTIGCDYGTDDKKYYALQYVDHIINKITNHGITNQKKMPLMPFTHGGILIFLFQVMLENGLRTELQLLIMDCIINFTEL